MSSGERLQPLFRALTQTEGGVPSTFPAAHVCPINCQGREINSYRLKFLRAESIPVGEKKHRYVENELFWEGEQHQVFWEKNIKIGFSKGKFETNILVQKSTF